MTTTTTTTLFASSSSASTSTSRSNNNNNNNNNNNSQLDLESRLVKILEEHHDTKDSTTSALPIFDVLESVRESLASKPNLLLQAAPGAGKTTIVPLQLLLDLVRSEGGGEGDTDTDTSSKSQILVVAPRRVAVRSAAQRMASLLGEERPGGTVGYSMRDESRVSRDTRIRVVTDGVLLNMLRQDPLLEGISVVVLDEFHERGVGSDTCLALLREVQQNFREDDLKIVIMSATLLGNANANGSVSGDNDEHDDDESAASTPSTGTKLMATLGRNSLCGIVESEGRQYPIQMQWANQVVKIMSNSNSGGGGRNGIPPLGTLLRDRKLLIQTVSNVVERAALKQAPNRGDVLVFLPGVAECRGVVRELSSRSSVAGAADVFALYGAMPKDEQDRVLYPSRHAQTGDSDSHRRQRVIVSTPIAEASLTIPGRFLVEIGALERTDDDHRFLLTDRGREISKMPCHPRLATAISEARKRSDVETLLAASVAAAFCLDDESSATAGTKRNGNSNNDDPNLAYTIQSVLQTPSKFSALGRFARRVCGNEGKLAVEKLQKNENDFGSKAIANLGKAMLPGFIDLVGERKGDASYDSSNYFMALGKSCRLGFRKSPPYILAVETNTGPDGISRVRSYVPLSKDLLEELAVDKELLYTVPSKGYQVRAKQVKSVGQIELSSSPLPSPSSDQISKALLDAMTNNLGGIANALLMFLAPNEKSKVEELVSRIRLDKELTGDNDWPPCFEALDPSSAKNGNDVDSDNRQQILTDLVEPWLGSVKSLKELKTLDVLLSALSPERQKYLDEYYPVFVNAPDGSKVPVRYIRHDERSDGDETLRISFRPMATAKLQQFFGARETLRVGPSSATIPLTLSLVSPAGKPLAETGDLPFFWKEVYPSIRSEMRGKYPKHPWPEDPLMAVATRKTKKQLSNGMDDTVATTDSKKEGRGKKKRKREK
eukprot:jgi/Psemu1/184229/e_gw1.38.100.1